MSQLRSVAVPRAAQVAGAPLAVGAGALAVALAAQVAVPLPFTPVPATLQPLAVLVVAGLLGSRLGAASMVLYLSLGAAGLPVFTPGGLPGIARLLGPTGGYLLAYPAAAALVGWCATGGWSTPRFWVGLVGGMAAIHVGGVAQLAILTGGVEQALRVGSLPFLAADGLKVVVAGLAVGWLARPRPIRV